MTLKERIKKHYKSQAACARVLRVKKYQQFSEALKDNTRQVGLQNRIIKHLDKLESKESK